MTTTESATAEERRDFYLGDIITSDLASGKYKEIVTRSRRGTERLPTYRPRQVDRA